jgi:hypothetical protein
VKRRPEVPDKNPVFVCSGRRGGAARAKKLTKAERVESAKKAINARWAKWRAEHAIQKRTAA